jgi:signal peptidase II
LKILRSYFGLIVVSGLVLFLDQWSKSWVRTHIPLSETWLPGSLSWLLPYARIVNWANTGTVFGLFQGRGAIFTVLAIVVSVAIVYYYPRVPAEDWWLRLAMCLQFGGALGNLTDRLMRTRVTDFISVGAFPVFNIADACITVGVVILIIGVWWKDRQEKKALASPPEGTGLSPHP